METLQGLAWSNEAAIAGVLDISMGGGAEIIVHGSEMDEMPAQNVISIAGTVNGASVVLPLTALTGKLFTLILIQSINQI
jgi:hypothetical protein